MQEIPDEHPNFHWDQENLLVELELLFPFVLPIRLICFMLLYSTRDVSTN